MTAALELPETIDLKRALITVDAISCQKSTAETCINQGDDYLLAVTGAESGMESCRLIE